MRPLILAIFPLWIGAAAAAAEPLTCASFRERLDGALLAEGPDSEAPSFQLASSRPSRGTRLNFSVTDLGGTLSCGPADQFEELEIDLRFTSKDAVDAALKRLMTLQGASLCALSSDSAPVCRDYGRLMVKDALEKMGRAFGHGAKDPSGIVDAEPFAGAHIEITSAPTLITFLLGPGRGATVDAARHPLPTPQPQPQPAQHE